MDDGTLAVAYEEDVINNPYSIKSWWRYLTFKQESGFKERKAIYERALKALPGSYKLWSHYLRERIVWTQRKRRAVKKRFATQAEFEAAWKRYDIACENLFSAFERALVFMNKMPRIWIMYCNALAKRECISRTRHTFDRALKSLPLTQHGKVWPHYLAFVKEAGVPETAIRVFRRYLQLEPKKVEEFVEYLISLGYIQEAVEQLLNICGDDEFESARDKSKHELWMQLCDLLCKHAKKIRDLDVDGIIRFGIRKFTDSVGSLWVSLAEYYIRLGDFERSRDVFEEAMVTVKTVRDFSLVWEAYSQYLERIVQLDMDADENDEEKMLELDLKIARYESVVDRRPLLLSSVLLRQNPHNVTEWHNRIKIFKEQGDVLKVLETYSQALATVDPQKATGKPHTLWVGYAMFYEHHEDLKNARVIFEKAVLVNFKNVHHLSTLWCYYVEMELRNRNYEKARALLKRALKVPAKRTFTGAKRAPQAFLYKSLPLWLLRVDLEESFGTYKSTVEMYHQILDLKIATPKVVMNFARFCEEHKYYEDAFKAYERGTALFEFPYSLDIWITYLRKFTQRYRNKNIERTRDLFEQVVEQSPGEHAKLFYLMYANFEEKYGLSRRAMYVYDRAAKNVAPQDRYIMFNIYIARAREFFGVTKTREIYDKAIDAVDSKYVPDMCLKYSNLETVVGEIDRARAIYIHGAQYSNPQDREDFWKKWHDFELRHGNEDTYSEMLRIRRSVQAQYNTQVNVSLDTSTPIIDDQHPGKRKMDEMQALEQQVEGEPPAKKSRVEEAGPIEYVAKAQRQDAEANPDEIDLDDDDDDINQEVGVEQLAVPKEVFGGLVQ